MANFEGQVILPIDKYDELVDYKKRCAIWEEVYESLEGEVTTLKQNIFDVIKTHYKRNGVLTEDYSRVIKLIGRNERELFKEVD